MKKMKSNLSNSYRPITLLPVFDKIFERDIFLLIVRSDLHDVVRPKGSCRNHFRSVTHDIYKPFDMCF